MSGKKHMPYPKGWRGQVVRVLHSQSKRAERRRTKHNFDGKYEREVEYDKVKELGVPYR